MMGKRDTLIYLAEIHYELGLINIFELEERLKIAYWLMNNGIADPRNLFDRKLEKKQQEKELDTSENIKILTNGNVCQQDGCILSLIITCGKSKWVFTKSDPDPYPSVPHGHENDQNNSWPKLNPYNGRVFSDMNKESRRLSKSELNGIWNNTDFRCFCIDMIGWFMLHNPNYRFKVTNPFRLPRRRY